MSESKDGKISIVADGKKAMQKQVRKLEKDRDSKRQQKKQQEKANGNAKANEKYFDVDPPSLLSMVEKTSPGAVPIQGPILPSSDYDDVAALYLNAQQTVSNPSPTVVRSPPQEAGEGNVMITAQLVDQDAEQAREGELAELRERLAKQENRGDSVVMANANPTTC